MRGCASLLASLVAVVLSLSAQPAQAFSYRDGALAFRQGDFPTASRVWLAAAESGDLDAQYSLAQLYLVGRGVTQDYSVAFKWNSAAAEHGHARAQFALGVMYHQGQGIARDDVAALTWYRRAAIQGVEEAQYNLSGMYAAGRGAPQDYLSARMWYIVAAAMEDAVVWNSTIPYGEHLTLAQNFLAMELARQCRESRYQRCGETGAAASAKF